MEFERSLTIAYHCQQWDGMAGETAQPGHGQLYAEAERTVCCTRWRRAVFSTLSADFADLKRRIHTFNEFFSNVHSSESLLA